LKTGHLSSWEEYLLAFLQCLARARAIDYDIDHPGELGIKIVL
jgi:hypothetical protein